MISTDLSRYFDNAATTPLDPRVLQEMIPFFGVDFGNANSIHSFGRKALDAVELARKRVAALIGAEDPYQVLFTSGATESNNQVLRSFLRAAVSPFEHSAILEPARTLGHSTLENDGLIVLPPKDRPELVSLMSVNNEIGTIWQPNSLSGSATYIHSDMTQAVGKVPIDLAGISFASFSAHKFYGPKGVGGLYFAETPPSTWILGGEQEHGLRGGTLNVPGIVGMGAAAQIAIDEQNVNFAHAERLRAIVLEGLEGCTDWQINGGSSVSPYILSVSFLTLEGESLVVEMDRFGYAISSGAACSSHSMEPSHVLTALKIDENWRRGTVRISFGRLCTAESASGLSKSLRHAVEKTRTIY